MAISTRIHQSISLVVFCLVTWVHPGESEKAVPKVVISGAIAEGAVCLDGTAPAYHWDAGVGEGARNWLIYLQVNVGGGWCINSTIYDNESTKTAVESCTRRAGSAFGSSDQMEPTHSFKGVLDDNANVTYFHDWNRVVVRYCDGGSFSGNADKPDPVTKLYYRGARIFQVVMKELMAKGLKDAQNVLLVGGSAGGVGVMIHCDNFTSQFSVNVRAKCIADSSLFLHVNDPKNSKFFDTVFGSVVDLQQPANALPVECTKKMSTLSCFFPKTLVQYVKSPMFLLNPAIDSYQTRNTFSEDLCNAIKNHSLLSPSDTNMLKDMRQGTISALPPPSSAKGYLITSLFTHAISFNIGLKGHMFPYNATSETMESAIVNWYFDRSTVNIIDPRVEPYYSH